MTGIPGERAADGGFEFEALDRAKNYRAGLVREFEPVLRGRVIEVGAGIGQFTAGLAALPSIQELVSVEPEPRFCETFRKLHPGRALLQGTVEALPADSTWDAIVSINVLEHVRNDEDELARYWHRLADRSGHLCLFVPARAEIYAPLDRDFGHYRRYARPPLRRMLERVGFSMLRLSYFNWVGYFAWWFHFCLLRKRQFDPRSVEWFDRVIFPMMHALERRVARPPFGQSLLAVARAEGRQTASA